MGNPGILRSSFGVSLATLLSRVLGLVRVMFEARVLGGGSVASAWFLAFAIPNLFRRLLGEGALGQTEVEESIDNIGYALPITQVGYVVDNILANDGKVVRGQLGVTVQKTDSNGEIDNTGRVAVTEEVTVISVTAGSAADSRLQTGDIIRSMQIGGTTYTITRMYQITDLLLNVRRGDSIVITVERNGSMTPVTVEFIEDSDFVTIA